MTSEGPQTALTRGVLCHHVPGEWPAVPEGKNAVMVTPHRAIQEEPPGRVAYKVLCFPNCSVPTLHRLMHAPTQELEWFSEASCI